MVKIMVKTRPALLITSFLFLTSCSVHPDLYERRADREPTIIEITIHDTVYVEVEQEMPSRKTVLPGIEVLKSNGFDVLKGKRIGLITNQTGVDTALRSTIDILYHAPDVDLVALFTPEHGIRGSEEAGKPVESAADQATGLPVYSLYGKTRQMTDDMVENLDAIVYDVQDIGCRSYTFISTMGLAMETCARNQKEFIVLDRPNPLGGHRVEGSAVEKPFISFVSQYPIPYVYGLTSGELAMYLNGEGLLGNDLMVDLSVVPMKYWERDMLYRETNLPWIPTSPHIPTMDSPMYYAMSGILGELGVISEGVGYTAPFKYFGAPWVDPDLLANELEGKIPGLFFRPVVFKPFYGKFKDRYCGGVEVIIRNPSQVNLIEVQFHVMEAIKQLYPDRNIFAEAREDRILMFDKVIGNDTIRRAFTITGKVESIRPYLNRELDDYRAIARLYWLYD